jgi:hypothetical protein
MSPKRQRKRRLDAFGLLLVLALGAVAVAGAYAALHFGWFSSPWHFAAWVVVIVAALVLAASLPAYVAPAPKNTLVHGAARPASETEAQAAARGVVKAREIDKQKFTD